MSLAIGELSYPLSDPGRNVRVEVDSTVELIAEVSLENLTVGIGSVELGSDVLLICWDMEGEGRISPEMLMFVVGDTGAEVLNSKALYDVEGCEDSEVEGSGWKLDVAEGVAVRVRGRNWWCLKAIALPFPPSLPFRLVIPKRWSSRLRSFKVEFLSMGVVDGRTPGRFCEIFVGEEFLEVGSEGILLVLDGDDDCERSVTTGWLNDEGGAPFFGFFGLDRSDRDLLPPTSVVSPTPVTAPAR